MVAIGGPTPDPITRLEGSLAYGAAALDDQLERTPPLPGRSDVPGRHLQSPAYIEATDQDPAPRSRSGTAHSDENPEQMSLRYRRVQTECAWLPLMSVADMPFPD